MRNNIYKYILSKLYLNLCSLKNKFIRKNFGWNLLIESSKIDWSNDSLFPKDNEILNSFPPNQSRGGQIWILIQVELIKKMSAYEREILLINTK